MRANIAKDEIIYLKTNKGNLYFTVVYIDAPVEIGTLLEVVRDSDNPFYALNQPRSVIASYSNIYTEFETEKRNLIYDSQHVLHLYNEQGTEIASFTSPTISVNNCLAISNAAIFIGSNGIAVSPNILKTYNYATSQHPNVVYTPNTVDAFGIYADPDYSTTFLASFNPTQAMIDRANAILYGSQKLSKDPFEPGGESEAGGGTGDFDGTSDPIDFPDLPELSAVDTGFICLFNPTIAQLQALGAYMWSDSLFDLDTWKKIFADPMDAILGLSIVPVNVPSGSTAFVSVGNMPTNITMNRASTQYVEVDCGTLNVNEYWGAYLDYSPFTKAEIYLPYIGTHAISVDDIMGKSVHVKYHVDILSGACAAYIKCGDSVLYTFIGQCASSIPITGNDWTNVINGAISAAVSIGTMVATGGAAAPLAVPALANTAVNGGMKPEIEKSGSLSGTGGMLGIQKPYLILTRPRQCLPAAQNEYMGYPSFISSVMGDLSGYTEVEQVHIDGIAATDAEISEIENLLKSGVIF